MATQFKIGLGLAAGAVAAHVGYTIHARTFGAPQGKNRRFSPGSVDETIAFTLKTGDLVLFQKNCGSYALLSGLTCLSRQVRLAKEANDKDIGAVFDHPGVIVMIKGEPYVLEEGTYGPVLLRYDERIKCSHSKKILIRPLLKPLSKPAAAALEKWAKEVGRSDERAAASMAGHPVPSGSAAEKDHMAPFKGFWHELQLAIREQREGMASKEPMPAARKPLRTVTGASRLVEEALAKATAAPTAEGPRRVPATAAAGDEVDLAVQDYWPPKQPFGPALQYGSGQDTIWVRDLR
jgi:hypothetical protein